MTDFCLVIGGHGTEVALLGVFHLVGQAVEAANALRLADGWKFDVVEMDSRDGANHVRGIIGIDLDYTPFYLDGWRRWIEHVSHKLPVGLTERGLELMAEIKGKP